MKSKMDYDSKNDSYAEQAKSSDTGKSGSFGGIGSGTGAGGSMKKLAVGKSKAYASQEHSPAGKGESGPSQKPGSGAMPGYVSKSQAYSNQAKSSQSSSPPSLGFAVSKEMKNAFGHFVEEKYLRQGHNYSGQVPMGGAIGPTSPQSYADDENKKAGGSSSNGGSPDLASMMQQGAKLKKMMED